ncbi:57e3c686-fe6f-4cc3-8a5a-0c55b211862c [Thermothielavioides terrestris]|uniref:57e3c686-fe6f-4cc3-8a5a-0c55b211862c n=1 Tax=Thermothielavioides terrestris TaxID=2587410 RepID=A0A446BTI3_9PEZI|nr:57e3c686-fe6f-4cc3-8a5a-0c55b211862c [Thermothielavioides terrestris]
MESGEYGSVYFYAPNKGAPVFFAVAFAVSGLFHVYQCIHYKSWQLTGLYVFCSVLFTAGFIVREMGAFDYENLIKYIISTCLIYAAPPLLELANYHILGRILYYAPYHSPIHPGRVLITFGFISFVVEALNGNGVAYSVNQSLPADKQAMGRALLKAALLIQLAVLALFVLLAVTFHRRCARAQAKNAGAGAGKPRAGYARLTAALRTLYASSALIGVRTVYRVAEYWSIVQGDGYWRAGADPASLSVVIRYEWFFWVWEASLMLVNHVLVNARHPRRYLPQSSKTYLALDGVTEVQGPGYKDGRPFWLTLVDPFDLWGLVNGRDKAARFWEQAGEATAAKEASRGVEAQV